MRPYRPPRPLDELEIRILGCLIEKELSSPNTYPLSLNALTAAVNQRSNRDPVLELDETEVEAGLERLLPEVLVWRVRTDRVPKWQHNLDAKWELRVGDKSILAELLLRGEQTPGELRSRTSRMHAFDELTQVGDALERLTELELVLELERRPGQKENRWRHLLGDESSPNRGREGVRRPESGAKELPDADLESRVARLEERLRELAAEVDFLRRSREPR